MPGYTLQKLLLGSKEYENEATWNEERAYGYCNTVICYVAFRRVPHRRKYGENVGTRNVTPLRGYDFADQPQLMACGT